MSRAALLPLDEQLCFSLYAANIAVNRTYKPLLDSMQITYPQYLVLNVLGEKDGMTVGAIADRLALDSSTVTPPVKRMEAAGLVERRRSKIDERQVHVWLTEDGRALLQTSSCLGEELVRKAGMSLEQFKTLNEQVLALRQALSGEADRGDERTL